ncbi:MULTISPECIES: histidine phosphatase family protein [Vibrio]|jgi:alpha-ribazole phosphatase|uniref:Alpha-ribazole phosphatase n=1 Tax=Vibrio mediterranei TaxID=689 RepID=A0A3G4VE68_9VIBR|nr:MULTISPECIES: histidine phosphatase family protein [Vibrio]AYV22705.1 alpha-ribazole phosphatase [Vibrio mediterranei]EDL54307.1 putative alpha-ribazole-5'-phosphate phosphatase CobC [Vibrio mediterranei AK1]MCF4173027.1 histidine phosphatase family protein [Vibrio sp. McD22-P3]MCG9658951.1 histidine phosphatase family protein [Vibrio mediterranei]MCG9786702.1 histidine phosphatase family protein [Vibrio mediterranei]
MQNILLMRHGKVSAPPALYGVTDVEVAKNTNLDIVSALAATQIDIQNIYSSPLKRCATLAQMVSQTMNIDVAHVDELAEMNFGTFDGVPFDKMSKQDWLSVEPFWSDPVNHPLPQAESLSQFRARVLHGWHSLLALLSQPNKTTLVVAHGGVIRLILAEVVGLDWANPKLYSTLDIGNASITHLQFNSEFPAHVKVKTVGASLHSFKL